MKTFKPALILFLCLAPVLVFAQSGTNNDELTRDVIRAKKKWFVGNSMSLTDMEQKGFWPVYDEYQIKLRVIYDRTGTLIQQFVAHHESLTDARAKDMLDEWFELDEEKLKLDKKYATALDEVIPTTKVLRYMQIESKLDSVIRAELARVIPMARLPKQNQ